MQEPVTLALDQPIRAENKEVKELRIRPPNGGAIRRCGNPFNMLGAVDGNRVDLSQIAINDAAALKMISELADIPPSSVDQLSLLDYQACLGVLFGFLAPSSPTPAS